MEEYIEEILEDNDSTMELLASLDFDEEYMGIQFDELFVGDDNLYHQ